MSHDRHSALSYEPVTRRRCHRCGISLAELGPRSRAKYCAPCRAVVIREQQSRHAQAHPERIKANRDRWRHKNPGKDAQYYKKNAARIKARSREWYRANRARALDRFKAAYRSNPERWREAGRKWRAENHERHLAHCNRAWHKRRALLRNGKSRGVSHDEWQAILAAHGHRCAYCGVSGRLTRDHVVPISRGGLDEPRNVVPACRACNYSKHATPLEEWLKRRHDRYPPTVDPCQLPGSRVSGCRA